MIPEHTFKIVITIASSYNGNLTYPLTYNYYVKDDEAKNLTESEIYDIVEHNAMKLWKKKYRNKACKNHIVLFYKMFDNTKLMRE